MTERSMTGDAEEHGGHRPPRRQFSLFALFGLMTVCAVVFAAVRAIGLPILFAVPLALVPAATALLSTLYLLYLFGRSPVRDREPLTRSEHWPVGFDDEPSNVPPPEQDKDGALMIRHRETGELLYRIRPGAASGVDLRKADLSGAMIARFILNGADLGSTNLTGADLRYADLKGADLQGSRLRGANLAGASLQDAKLRHADFRSANLSATDLSGADLECADMSSAVLQGAELGGANLSEANLIGADLRDANLRGALGLASATLTEVIQNSTTRWPDDFQP